MCKVVVKIFIVAHKKDLFYNIPEDTADKAIDYLIEEAKEEAKRREQKLHTK